MPSASFVRWQTDRMPRLAQIDAQCATTLGVAAPNPHLTDENLRGYVMALSAHFQGFCRDLYTEASQILVAKVSRPALAVLFQAQFTAHRKLDHGNPNLDNLKADFKRFGFSVDFEKVDLANKVRLTDLAKLSEWRNIAAHQGTPTAKAGPLNLPLVASWRSSCDGLAVSLDDMVYNQLKKILRRKPW